ncbi:MAG: cell division protein ZapA [Gemmatimonadetes bacterium]|nr:cell division protein ZapA [Gemmatimonadota bacterium]
MTEDKSSVTVRIAGEEHTIRANAAPEYTKKCAALVDDRIASIKAMSGLIEGHRAAILAALTIADEYFQASEEAERIRLAAASRVNTLAERIEGELGSGG